MTNTRGSNQYVSTPGAGEPQTSRASHADVASSVANAAAIDLEDVAFAMNPLPERAAQRLTEVRDAVLDALTDHDVTVVGPIDEEADLPSNAEYEFVTLRLKVSDNAQDVLLHDTVCIEVELYKESPLLAHLRDADPDTLRAVSATSATMIVAMGQPGSGDYEIDDERDHASWLTRDDWQCHITYEDQNGHVSAWAVVAPEKCFASAWESRRSSKR